MGNVHAHERIMAGASGHDPLPLPLTCATASRVGDSPSAASENASSPARQAGTPRPDPGAKRQPARGD